VGIPGIANHRGSGKKAESLGPPRSSIQSSRTQGTDVPRLGHRGIGVRNDIYTGAGRLYKYFFFVSSSNDINTALHLSALEHLLTY